ncbi:MAG: peptide ABC transporter substrate-binding protein [Clostridia bacterium]|nr:peptide ABC transporter substrate-binding protein [Clostridia bacterium]MBQ6475782.1 peptide ABC transporter substrate-binding protein [Clostridia bacterium]MBR0445574.1 peptide ABC transporter substrate-binding protein [Clostridia bacterium]MCR5073958.1 peptide ABC transporter substrate-binding protein [Clostridiales bacterium]
MKVAKRWLPFLLIVCLLAGCAGAPEQAAAGGSAAAPQQSGSAPAAPAPDGAKVLNVGRMAELFDMDSTIATEADCLEVIEAIIEPLFVTAADGTPTPAMCESYEMNDDGTLYTFHIRSQANWMNGVPVTAHDFVYAWRRLVDPVTASEYSFMMEVAAVKNATACITGEKPLEDLGVRAEDDKTLVVELDRPVTYFLNLMAFPSFCPINEAYATEKGSEYALGADNLLCCGPFYMSAWDVGGNTYQIRKNPTYWDAENVKLDEINFQIIKDPQQTMLAYESGDLDYVRLSGDQIVKYETMDGFTRIEEGYLWYLSPNLNPKSPEYSTGLENENLRKAIALSYDKDAICFEILQDGSTPADFAIPNKLAIGPDGKDFRETTGTYLTTDKAKAKEYWETAKSELGVSEVNIELLYDDSDSTPLIAQFLQSEIENNLQGVHISLKAQPKKSRTQLMQDREYQLGLTRWGPDYADPMTYLDMWTTGSTYNYGEWSNEEYDKLIADANGALATDPAARWEALKKAEALVMEHAVILPVYQKGTAAMVRPGISGLAFFPVGVGTIYKDVDVTF